MIQDERMSRERLNPIRDGRWADADGTTWRRRGDGAGAVKRMERLIRAPDVRVLLVYGPDAPTEIVPADREELWQRIRPHLRGTYERGAGDMSDFQVAEFKDDRHRSLLIVQESC